MSAERVVPVLTVVEGDSCPTYAACPFCGTPVHVQGDESYAHCANCREPVRYVLLPDQPDEAPERTLDRYLTKRARRVEPSADVRREATGLVLTIAGAVRIALGRDWNTAHHALSAWMREYRRVQA
jgi:hypothetical protein